MRWLLLLALACDAAPEVCPAGTYETTFSEAEPGCPELVPVISIAGVPSLGPSLGGRCDGERLQSGCGGHVALVCDGYTFAGDLRWEGDAGTGTAVLGIAGRSCHYQIASRRR